MPVKSSVAMEPYAAKSMLHNLVWNFKLPIDTFTTDRSKTMRSMMRLNKINSNCAVQFKIFQ